jgi:hypothetical protein
MRISMTRREIDANNWFYSKAWGKGTDHLPISCQEGVVYDLFQIHRVAYI